MWCKMSNLTYTEYHSLLSTEIKFVYGNYATKTLNSLFLLWSAFSHLAPPFTLKLLGVFQKWKLLGVKLLRVFHNSQGFFFPRDKEGFKLIM